MNSIESVTKVEEPEAIEANGTAAAVGTIETVEVIETVEAVKVIDTVDTIEVIETAEAVELIETVDTVEVIETVEAVEVIETVHTVEVIETAEAVEVIDTVDTIEAVEEVADVAVTSGSEASTLVNSADADWASSAELSVETSDDFGDDDDFAAAMAGSSSMADLVDDFQFKPLKAGETRDGIIVSISPNEILVDVGAKSEGFVHQREMERLGKEYISSLSVGDSVVVYVVRPEDREGNVVLSLARAQQERDWREAERLQESTDAFDAPVIGYNRGGVICRVGKVRGFVPASQLVTKPETKGDVTEENRYASLVGRNLWVKVVELDRKRNRLILSERLASRDRRKVRKDELLGELKKGDSRKGRVSSLAKFGAFVDLGGADGLIHLSELSWSRVNHPSEVIKVGDEVDVYVLNVDRDRKRIGLSLRRLEPEPWSVVHDRYAVGQIVEGVITKLASFGAFARVDGTLEGLIHISELANHRVTHPKEVVKEGDVLQLRVIRIDPARRRMGLSLKRVAEDAYAEYDWRETMTDQPEEDWVEGPEDEE
jgi:small subunit ribosomal protein S1